MFYFAHCINIIFNSLLAQLVKYDVNTTRKIKFIHTICYHILLFYRDSTGLQFYSLLSLSRLYQTPSWTGNCKDIVLCI